MNQKLQSALSLAQLGLRVFPATWILNGKCSCEQYRKDPCNSPGKHPLRPGWQTDATTDEQAIRGFWNRFPAANPAIATGKESGVWVLDIDPRHGGDDSLHELEEKFGALPETWTVLTGSKGRHIYFQYDPRPENKVSIRPGLDIRNDGGLVIAPGAVHFSGGSYEWEASGHPDDVRLATTPEWLLRMMTLNEKAPHRIPEIVKDGERNQTLCSLAGSMRRRGMSQEAIDAALQKENVLRCIPPLDPNEVSGIAASISKKEPHTEQHGMTDLGNARRMVDQQQGRLLYSHERKEWYSWNERYWQIDNVGLAMEAAKQIPAVIAQESLSMEGAERKALYQFAIKSQHTQRIKAALDLAKSDPRIAVTQDQFDTDPWSLNCMNGILNLRTGSLTPHNPGLLCQKFAPVDYDPEAECPTFMEFLDQIFESHTDTINFVKRAVGYGLTGSKSEQCLFILHGVGANGKTTLMELIGDMLGSYSTITAPGLLMEKHNQDHPTGLADLAGRRFVISEEVNQRRVFNEELVKQMTGGMKIKARFMRGNFFDYDPIYKIYLCANHKPVIRGTDYAIWRRIYLIPFNVVIPKPEQDKQLPVKLRRELPGVLRWAFEGCLDWQEVGLEAPESVLSATQEYRMESDTFSRFVDEECHTGQEMKISAGDLLKRYNQWCEKQNERPIRQRDLAALLREHGYCNLGIIDKTKRTYWGGLCLKYETDLPM